MISIFGDRKVGKILHFKTVANMKRSLGICNSPRREGNYRTIYRNSSLCNRCNYISVNRLQTLTRTATVTHTHRSQQIAAMTHNTLCPAVKRIRAICFFFLWGKYVTYKILDILSGFQFIFSHTPLQPYVMDSRQPLSLKQRFIS